MFELKGKPVSLIIIRLRRLRRLRLRRYVDFIGYEMPPQHTFDPNYLPGKPFLTNCIYK